MTCHMLAGSGIMRNNLEMLLARGALQVTQLCVPHEGNPPVLMRRPSIFNLETVPSVNGRRGGVSPPVPAGPLKTKGGREQCASHNVERSSAAALPLSHNKPAHVCKYRKFKRISFVGIFFWSLCVTLRQAV